MTDDETTKKTRKMLPEGNGPNYLKKNGSVSSEKNDASGANSKDTWPPNALTAPRFAPLKPQISHLKIRKNPKKKFQYHPLPLTPGPLTL